MNRATVPILIMAGVGCLWSPLAAVGQCSFQGVGDLPGGIFRSYAYDVSADGSVVVGTSFSEPGWQAFRWTAKEGMVGLGDLPGGSFHSIAEAISADGSVIVGRGRPEGGLVYEACRWTAEEGIVGLGFLPGEGPDSIAFCASDDGSVIGGRARSTDFGMDIGFRWTADEGMVSLGVLDNGKPTRGAWAVPADGSVMVGTGGFPNESPEAYRWTARNGAMALGFLPGGTSSGISVLTPDGLIAFGGSSSTQGPQLVRWTEAEGMIGLGVPMNAKDVTADGSVVVGNDVDTEGATIWDAENGMRFLHDVLVTEYGLDLTGWVLEEAQGISADGSTIVGWGFNPDGNREGWIARIGKCDCAWDLDTDGSVGASDLLALLVAWGTDPGGPPDFDGDGNVGASDLLALLVNWGPCP